MTTNDSTPTVPTPIDPASQIALAVLARFFDDRREQRSIFAEECRASDDNKDAYPEQKAIADTWRHAADIVWELLGGRPDADRYSRRVHTVEMDVRELGKLIAMATARQESSANECSNAERTQYELTIEQQKTRIAELETRLSEAETSADDLNQRYHNRLAERDEARAKIADSEKQLAALASAKSPVTP